MLLEIYKTYHCVNSVNLVFPFVETQYLSKRNVYTFLSTYFKSPKILSIYFFKKTELSTYWSSVGVVLRICLSNKSSCGILGVKYGTYHSIALISNLALLIALFLFKTELSAFLVGVNLYHNP